MRKSVAMLAAAFLLLDCAPKPSEKIDLSKTRASFMLADGSSISTDASDEYNPILMTRDDGFLVLLFASNRDCGGCTPGYQNLFVSVSTDAYYDDLELPTFNNPVVVLPNGSNPAETVNRMEFVAEASGPNIVVAFKGAGSIYLFQLDAAGQSTGAGVGYGAIGNLTRMSDSLVGFGPEPGTMLTRDGSNIIRYSMITAPHNGRAATNGSYATADTVTRINPLYTGFLGATFSADSGYLTMGTLYQDFGYHPNFQDAIDEEGLYLTSAQVFDAGASTDDLLLFSAHDGTSEDLYVVNSHTVGELWDQVGIYGGYNDSTELRNIWYPVAATLPANRGFMAAAVSGDSAYLIGGTADGTTIANTIYEFDFASETFTNCGGSCGTWPVNIWHAPAVEYGGLIYVIGGATAAGAAFGVNTIRSFNPGNLAINNALNTLPVSRQSVAATTTSGKIFAMGGVSTATDCTGGTGYGCTSNYSYDIGGNAWSGALSAVSHSFSAGGAAVYGDSIFAFGGYTNSGILETNAVGQYSVTGNTWIDCGSTCPTLSTARYGFQAVAYGSSAYILGGVNQGGTSFDSVEEFDMASQAFTDCDGGCATMPLPRNGGSAVLHANQIFYFGGNNGSYVNTIYKYIP